MGGIQSRRQRLARHYLVDGAATERLSETVTLAASALDFPNGQVNIIDEDRQYTIGGMGAATSTPRTETMCQFTVDGGDVLAVGDLRVDRRWNRLPGVLAGVATSYLGVALRSREAAAVGTLCVIDSRPRTIDAEQVRRIRQFGAIVEDQLDVIRRSAGRSRGANGAAAELAAAIDNDRIVPWYQPIVDLGTDRVVGYEALARWYHRTGEIEDPARFVALAEDSDLVLDLDRAVLRRSAVDLRRWQRTNPAARLNVNLSTLHLSVTDGVDAIERIVLDAGVAPDSIDLELTESHELVDRSAARAAVQQLRERGFRVLLDDFGNGWSSLEWVLNLPITGLKIDRAVTAALGTPVGNAVARALVSLTDEVDLDVVIEGISSRNHAMTAKSLGCRYGQGYYWSTPVPAHEANGG